MTRPIDVLYIAGWGRSGSTILDNILDQIEGVVSVGEVKFLWERGLTMGSPCGCGRRLDDCPFWSQVLMSAFGGRPDDRLVARLDRSAQAFRTRHLPLLLISPIADRYVRRFAEYSSRLVDLYEAIASRAEARLIVDSSKYPPYLALLQRIPDMRVRTLHLVRDPRAVAHSWQRRRDNPDIPEGGEMPRLHPALTGLYWTLWNAAIERIGRQGGDYRRVRYEDLVSDPRGVVEEIVDFAELGNVELPFLDHQSVSLAVNHTVSGNPSRFNTGTVTLEADVSWIGEMSASARRWAELTSAPLRGRYGY